MYFDEQPCRTCGADVRLQPRSTPVEEGAGPGTDGPVGPADGVVGSGDPTVDQRTCTNAECPTNTGDADAEV